MESRNSVWVFARLVFINSFLTQPGLISFLLRTGNDGKSSFYWISEKGVVGFDGGICDIKFNEFVPCPFSLSFALSLPARWATDVYSFRYARMVSLFGRSSTSRSLRMIWSLPGQSSVKES